MRTCLDIDESRVCCGWDASSFNGADDRLGEDAEARM